MVLLERLTVDGDHDHVHEGDTTSLNCDLERAYCSSPGDTRAWRTMVDGVRFQVLTAASMKLRIFWDVLQ
jgi:hypothetical protein